MRFDVITLFPELFAPHQTMGVTRRAFEPGKVDVKLWQLRDFADAPQRRVDDRPYGGGPGMVMLAEPLARAVDAAATARGGPVPVVCFSPTGQRLTQAWVQEFAKGPGAILVCGRYEAIDQRFIDARVDHEISLGDFVLSGGEIAALALMDAVVRLLDGVLGENESHRQDSFSDGLLEGPHYSRPESWGCEAGSGKVPTVLLSGDHAAIRRWRRAESLRITAQRRPDLIEAARAAGLLAADDERFLSMLKL